MKKFLSLFVTVLLFISCEGPAGPPGPPGLPGEEVIFLASAFEIEVDFTAQNGYSIVEPYGFEVFPSDVTLVYIQWDSAGGQPIWRLLPQIVEFQEGQLQYNFDFTRDDVSIFLDGTIDFGLLGSEWTQNQVFRVVVIPADNVDAVNISSLEAVSKAGNISSFERK